MQRLNPASLPPSVGQSQIVVTGGARTAYLSGQVALDSDGDLVGEGDFDAQTRQVLVNLDHALRAIGATRHDVAKLTIYVVDLDPTTHGPVLGEHLGDLSSFGHPAATLLSVQGLARPEFSIEIEAVVAVK